MRAYFSMVLATHCGFRIWSEVLEIYKCCQLYFIRVLIRRSRFATWSVYPLCKLENSTICFSVWHQATKGSTRILDCFKGVVLKKLK